MSLSLIVAMDENRLIGNKNALPWHFREDLRFFKRTTDGHTVAMGRKTFESIRDSLGGPLPNRTNVVFSKTIGTLEGASVVHDVEAYLKDAATRDEEIFVIGGAKIYALALPYAKRLYITHVEGEYEGDTTFPEIDFSKFEKVDETIKPPLTFSIYERRPYA